MSFEGKTAWITGASSGIGAALAREWANRGARIILSGRDEARLASVAEGIETETLILPFDVRDDVEGISVPTLALVGEYDRLTPPSYHGGEQAQDGPNVPRVQNG